MMGRCKPPNDLRAKGVEKEEGGGGGGGGGEEEEEEEEEEEGLCFTDSVI
jgi:hypothetical protein